MGSSADPGTVLARTTGQGSLIEQQSPATLDLVSSPKMSAKHGDAIEAGESVDDFLAFLGEEGELSGGHGA